MNPLALGLQVVGMVAVISGMLKLLDPGSVSRAMHVLSLPDGPWAARVLGAVEVALGTAAVLVGGPVFAGLLALAYGALAVAARRLQVVGPDVPCGCVGRTSAPASTRHVVVNLVAALVAAVAAATGTGGLYDTDALGLVEVVRLAVATVLAVLVVVALGAGERPSRNPHAGRRTTATWRNT